MSEWIISRMPFRKQPIIAVLMLLAYLNNISNFKELFTPIANRTTKVAGLS